MFKVVSEKNSVLIPLDYICLGFNIETHQHKN